MPLDPRLWKREHQVALLIAAGVGAFLGLWHVYAELAPVAKEWGMNWGSALMRYWFSAIFWPVFGAAIGAAVVYVLRLIRS